MIIQKINNGPLALLEVRFFLFKTILLAEFFKPVT